MLGKRKREVAVATRPSQPTPAGNATTTTLSDAEREIFRQYFESSFEPLPAAGRQAPPLIGDGEDASGDNSETESEWEGLSDPAEERATVEVIEHRVVENGGDDAEEQRQQYKLFMVSGYNGELTAQLGLNSTAEFQTTYRNRAIDPKETQQADGQGRCI